MLKALTLFLYLAFHIAILFPFLELFPISQDFRTGFAVGFFFVVLAFLDLFFILSYLGKLKVERQEEEEEEEL